MVLVTCGQDGPPCPGGLNCESKYQGVCSDVPPLCADENTLVSHIYSDRCYIDKEAGCVCHPGAWVSFEGVILPSPVGNNLIKTGQTYKCAGTWTKDGEESHIGKAYYTCKAQK